MGYDPKAVLVKKEIKVLAGSDRTFLKLMKNAIEQQARQALSRKRSSDSDK